MPVTDIIADQLARIRNAGTARHKTVEVSFSNLKYNVAKIMKENGYLEEVEHVDEGVQGKIIMTLRYYKREPSIINMVRVSKPGRRIYAPADKLPRVKNGLGIAIISTSKGVISDKEARKLNVGGEVLCTIW